MDSVSLYIHIPFCEAKCAYCNFNSYAGLESLYDGYVDALVEEMAIVGGRFSTLRGRTIYLGGGTPTVLSLQQLKRILDGCLQAFVIDEGAEVSCEANPGTVDLRYLEGLRHLGVGRLSLGVQSLYDDELQLLGRVHTSAQATGAFEMARQAGFDNLNLDLIYAFPRHTLKRWRSTLERAVALEPEHLSLYPLSLEEGTPLWGRVESGELRAPDDDLAAEMYLLAEELLQAYRHYEISNWAKPGYESRHNLTYWRNEGYLGFGAGAHSYYGGRRFWNVARPEEYIRRLKAGPSPRRARPGQSATEGEEVIQTPLEMAETVFMGLRLSEGVGFEGFKRRFGRDLSSLYGRQLKELVAWGLLEENERGIRLTPRGRLLGNEVFEKFLPLVLG
ncbi:MAG: radical SAM family heme chaperone HemW [Anaerolineae bacterium]|nr:radical SAM family heme chaperone HemW [Anaerolineae bacterium]